LGGRGGGSGGEGHPKKMTALRGGACEKIDKLRVVTRFLYEASHIPPAPPPS